MKNLDSKIDLKESAQKLGEAFASGKEAEIQQAFINYSAAMRDEIMQEAKGVYDQYDRAVMIARGASALTTKETEYYQKVIDCMQSVNPKQALANENIKMPETIIDKIFEDLQKNHPLLNSINFVNTNADIKMLVNKHTKQLAAWGKLHSGITKELESDFEIIQTGLYKLSAFLPVSNDMLDLGPSWIDRYVRVILTEALSLGLEDAIVNGDGNGKPIGMSRQVGGSVTVTGGVYPLKEAVKVTDFSPVSYGNLLAALSDNGKRKVENLLLIVNSYDYYKTVMPATTFQTPNGGYVNNVLPYPTQIIESTQVPSGKAVIGIGKNYFMSAGLSKGGKIEQSDEYHFLEDERLYLIKCHANGMPLNATDFLLLDISELQPLYFSVKNVAQAAETGTGTAETPKS